MSRFFYALTFLFLMLFPGISSADVQLGQVQANEGMSPLQLPYFEDRTGSNSASQAQAQFARAREAKQITGSSVLQFSPEGGTYWIELSATNRTVFQDWQLSFLPEKDNIISPIKSLKLYNGVDENPIASWPLDEQSKNPSLPVFIKSGEATTRYVLVETWPQVHSSVRPVLKTKAYVASETIDMAQKVSLLWLMIGAVCGAGLVQLLLTRQPIQGMLAINALLVGIGMFVLQRSELLPASLLTIHPVMLPLSVAMMFGVAATMMLWIASSRYTLTATICVLPFLLNAFVFMAAIYDLSLFNATGMGVEKLPHYLLSITGLTLLLITFRLGFANISMLWFIPAWLALTAMPWVSAYYPFTICIMYVVFLGVAGVASVFWHWKKMDTETESLQRRLRHELKNIKDKYAEENDTWNKKMESQRVMLTEMKEREQYRASELEIAKKEADAANKAKSDFLAVISHEIRTPMNGIMGIVQIIEQTPLNDKQFEYIDVIKNSGETMVTLLNDILDYSKIEKGLIDLETIPFSMRKLVHSVATLMSGRSKEKGINIVIDIDDHIPDTYAGDPGRIRQILLNLVSNAVKFTERGSVSIRVTQPSPGKTMFEVIDTGLGISAEAQEKLFQAYVQADASINRRFGGTGLGLNICRMLVTAMNGTIGLSSVENQGSTFWFDLPLLPADAHMADGRKDDNTAQKADRRLSILAIDDNALNLKIVSSLLEMDGHEVTIASSGETALQFIEQSHFDIIFVDIRMPTMDGQTFMNTLKQNPDPQRASIPVFALTGMVSPEMVQEITAVGIRDVLPKPVTQTALRKAISQIVNENSAPQALDVSSIISMLSSMSDGEKEALRSALAPAQQKKPETDMTLLNMQILGELKQSLPRDTLAELFTDLIEKSKEMTSEMEPVLAAGDFNALGEIAHNLKGMAGNFGLQGMMDHHGAIEKAVRDGDNEKAAALTKDNRSVLDQSLATLDAWLKS